MKRRFAAGLAAVVAVTAGILTASGAAAATPDVATAGAPGASANSKLPVAIQVDETQNKVVASFVGIGKQVYDCNAAGTAFVFREPVAGLLSRGVQAAIHGKGPFWASFDGSRVEASSAGSAPSPDPARNVLWLKLASTLNAGATGVFSNVKFIQRLDTRGGVAPTGTCSPLKTVAVDYTANYVFWAPK